MTPSPIDVQDSQTRARPMHKLRRMLPLAQRKRAVILNTIGRTWSSCWKVEYGTKADDPVSLGPLPYAARHSLASLTLKLTIVAHPSRRGARGRHQQRPQGAP
jgi:hypothetical protein